MKQFQSHILPFTHHLRGSFLDLSVVVGIIVFFQLIILREIPDNWPEMIIGLGIIGIGLALFMRGLEIGIFPLGEGLARHFASAKTRTWLMIFAFVIGFTTTIAEPALIAVAHKAAIISSGAINALALRIVVALAVGLAIVIGVVRIILNHPIQWYIVTGYGVALAVTYFAPPEIIGLAYDSGGVTTSTVTVPLIAALGVGLATSLQGRNPLIDGFGLIAFASLTPMIFVQLYGIIAYNWLPASTIAPELAETVIAPSSALVTYGLKFLTSVMDVLPIVLTILFFYYVVLQQKIEAFGERTFGFFLVVLGLYAFVVGLEIGLFPLGESVAAELAGSGIAWQIFAFAFLIGFATTLAEPALTVIAGKAQEVSGGAVQARWLRVFVAIGVGFGVLLGVYRIMQGDAIIWYIMAGYLVVVIQTIFAPRTIIPIAYDSGGVTTSTITVPIVAALGLGLAAKIPGADPLIDGFGLIAFASLCPMITVLGYGILRQEKIRRHEKRMKRMESQAMDRALKALDDEAGLADVLRQRHHDHKQIITLTGQPGSGVSSVARAVGQVLHFRNFSSGDLFRRIAQEQGMSPAQLNDLAAKYTVLDEEIDRLIRELGRKDNQLVLDSRLGHYWIYDSFKVYLKVDISVATDRIHAQIERGERHVETDSSLHEYVQTQLEQQAATETQRYQALYGIDITNTRPFNLIIDTSHKTVDEIVEEIIKAYRRWDAIT